MGILFGIPGWFFGRNRLDGVRFPEDALRTHRPCGEHAARLAVVTVAPPCGELPRNGYSTWGVLAAFFPGVLPAICFRYGQNARP